MRDRKRLTARPFTLFVCRGECGGPESEAVLEPLRDYVRTSPHGVLVATGCLRAALHCSTDTPFQAARHGVFALVQPCDEDRRPTATPTRLGPLRGRADTTPVCAWLRSGMPADSLPQRLRAAPPPHRTARMN